MIPVPSCLSFSAFIAKPTVGIESDVVSCLYEIVDNPCFSSTVFPMSYRFLHDFLSFDPLRANRLEICLREIPLAAIVYSFFRRSRFLSFFYVFSWVYLGISWTKTKNSKIDS